MSISARDNIDFFLLSLPSLVNHGHNNHGPVTRRTLLPPKPLLLLYPNHSILLASLRIRPLIRIQPWPIHPRHLFKPNNVLPPPPPLPSSRSILTAYLPVTPANTYPPLFPHNPPTHTNPNPLPR